MVTCAAQAQHAESVPRFQAATSADLPSVAVLASFVRAKDAPGGAHWGGRSHRFCFVRVSEPRDEPQWTVWMYWNEGRELVSWPASSPPGSAGLVGAMSSAERGRVLARGRSIRLATDVVAKPEDVGSSTYLVHRGWVRSVLSHCRSVGRWQVVPAKP